MTLSLENSPHRRFNPLLDEWVLVSPHRTERPWSGKVESAPAASLPAYDPDCYLCPRNTRSSGAANPDYTDTFVFDNDFPALVQGAENADRVSVDECGGLVRAVPERGICRVVCFSPRHDLTLARMDTDAIGRVIDLWVDQYVDLGARDFISHVLIFENKGETMGCSNPHPHGQIWATERVPSLARRKIESQLRYRAAHGRAMLMDYLEWELGEGRRIVASNAHWVALVPFWAVWPFEATIAPRREVSAIAELDPSERAAWAAILRDLTIRYDNLFGTSFPYSMGIHQRPTDGGAYEGVVLHQSFYPPLLRSATIKKFQVGYEMSGEPQRDITPETAAAKLREKG
ncbi:UDP-glucose--hexose-1-phosphate uridylyltransferase [Candidatus Sumerlaeota bacterium]|nr:UDP-glucose--hexose-1-phosphate uridylyltransferase [Candidatus Sumerlaeota bacterium]